MARYPARAAANCSAYVQRQHASSAGSCCRAPTTTERGFGAHAAAGHCELAAEALRRHSATPPQKWLQPVCAVIRRGFHQSAARQVRRSAHRAASASEHIGQLSLNTKRRKRQPHITVCPKSRAVSAVDVVRTATTPSEKQPDAIRTSLSHRIVVGAVACATHVPSTPKVKAKPISSARATRGKNAMRAREIRADRTQQQFERHEPLKPVGREGKHRSHERPSARAFWATASTRRTRPARKQREWGSGDNKSYKRSGQYGQIQK